MHLVPADRDRLQVDRLTARVVRRWRQAQAQLALLKLARRAS